MSNADILRRFIWHELVTTDPGCGVRVLLESRLPEDAGFRYFLLAVDGGGQNTGRRSDGTAGRRGGWQPPALDQSISPPRMWMPPYAGG